jgi:hypothetical protein
LGPVLFIQDGTELDYTPHPDTSGLGFIGDGRGQGMELQSTLCAIPGPDPEILGIAFSSAWTRDHAPRAKTEKRSERDARHKETDVWGDSVEAIGMAPQPDSGTRWISVSDRGSDVFTFFTRALALGWSCLVRSKHDRRMQDSDESAGRLHSFARSMPAVATTTLYLRARPGAPARNVLLNVAHAPVTLLAPVHTSGAPISAWCIRVWEDAEGGLEWILVSTDEVTSIQNAQQKIEWYRNRWLIEEYHKCLKTGCNIEKRQVSTKQSLLALLGFMGIVAVFLMQFKTAPDRVPIPRELKSALAALSQCKLEDLDSRAMLRKVAMLGGFLGRKGDGEPGWQSIWRGWNRLQDIVLGMQIASGILES